MSWPLQAERSYSVGHMKFLIHVLSVCVVFGCLLIPLAHADTSIIIVRHGEKTALGLGQLSCRGLNRSLALAPVLLSRYGNPVDIYAPNPSVKKIDKGVSYAYVRPLATIEPLAIRAGLPVNVDFGMADITQLAEALLAQTDGTQDCCVGTSSCREACETFTGDIRRESSRCFSWDDTDFIEYLHS